MFNSISFRVVSALCGWLALFTALPGCGHVSTDIRQINSNIDVFGVALYSRVDHRRLEGVTAETEPCILGYEYLFDQLDVTIGYTHKGVVRSIKTRNEDTSIFGIHPGDHLANAKRLLADQDFQAEGTPDTFRNHLLMLTLFPNENAFLFGVMVEIHSDQ